jgi:hypothetical protein
MPAVIFSHGSEIGPARPDLNPNLVIVRNDDDDQAIIALRIAKPPLFRGADREVLEWFTFEGSYKQRELMSCFMLEPPEVFFQPGFFLQT